MKRRSFFKAIASVILAGAVARVAESLGAEVPSTEKPKDPESVEWFTTTDPCDPFMIRGFIENGEFVQVHPYVLSEEESGSGARVNPLYIVAPYEIIIGLENGKFASNKLQKR